MNINGSPSSDDSRKLQSELLSLFYSGEVDKVELLYTNFVNLVSSEAKVRTLLPLNPTGMENEFDEIFTLSSKDGEMVVDVNTPGNKEEKSLNADTVFEQSPEQMVSALMPLFLGSQLLRAL